MSRSVRVRSECIDKVKSALRRNGYIRQIDLAEHIEKSQSTISNFLNGRPVDYLNFIEICRVLGLEWRDIADLESSDSASEDIYIQIKNIQTKDIYQEKEIPKSKDDTPDVSSFSTSSITLQFPTGQVKIGSKFYMQRPPIEERCYEEIDKLGSLIRMKAPRQMGKTSLLTRILDRGEKSGNKSVALNLQLATSKSFHDSDTFLKWFCASIALELNIPNELSDYWDLADIVGSSIACKNYFEQYLLPKVEQPLILGLDEVDRVFDYPEIYRDFFGLLRALHEEAKRRDIWNKLRLIIVHSTEVYVPLDINQSPFNVGLSVELPEFTSIQVLKLAQRYQINWSNTEVEQLMTMVGGHPFLVRLALYHIARQNISLTQLLQTASTNTGIYKEHLRRQELLLQEGSELATAMREVATASNPISLNSVTMFKLQGLGLIKLDLDKAITSCQLYRQYFGNC